MLNMDELSALEEKIDKKEHNPVNFAEFLNVNLCEDTDKILTDLDENSILFVCEPKSMSILVSIMKKFGAKIIVEDVMDLIFQGKIDTSVFNENLKETLDNILLENYNKDMVLDKILMFGTTNCLTEIDKKILEKEKPA